MSPCRLIRSIYGEINPQFHGSQSRGTNTYSFNQATPPNELATMVECLAAKLGLNLGEAQLALAGGVFVHQQAFVEKLQRRLALSEQFMTIVKEPVAGAVAIALNANNSEQ